MMQQLKRLRAPSSTLPTPRSCTGGASEPAHAAPLVLGDGDERRGNGSSTAVRPPPGPAAGPTVAAGEVRTVVLPRWQRTLDVVSALSLMVAAAPLYALTGLLVKLDGGPMLFVQHRVGAGGRIIELRKFRTMAVDAEARLHSDPVLYATYVSNGFKLPAGEDPRLGRFGRLLRSTSLDELPQLYNVLIGDMSMVGPRPVVPPELEEYRVRGAVEAYLSCRPGLTGLWQVNGRSSTTYDERVSYDREYLDRRSLRTDLGILLRTVPAVLRRGGAH